MTALDVPAANVDPGDDLDVDAVLRAHTHMLAYGWDMAPVVVRSAGGSAYTLGYEGAPALRSVAGAQVAAATALGLVIPVLVLPPPEFAA